MISLGKRLSRNTVAAVISLQRDFGSAAPFSMHRGHALGHASVPFAEAIFLRSVGWAELLDDRRGLEVVAVVVSVELAAVIGAQVLEAKSERHDKVLHEFDQSRHRLVHRRDEVDRLQLDVGVGGLDYEAVVPARRWRHGSREVGSDELKSLHDLGLARLFATWLLGTLVDLADVARGQRVIGSRLGDVPCGLQGALVRIS